MNSARRAGFYRIAAALTLVALASVTGVAAQQTEPHDISRYQVIIDRAPFGSVAGAGAEQAAQPNFAARFAFVGLVSSDDNTQVLAIIQDRERNRSYFPAEGEMIGQTGIQLVKIDRTASKVVLKQQLEVATLAYEARASAPMPMPGQEQAPPGVPTPRRVPFRRGG